MVQNFYEDKSGRYEIKEVDIDSVDGAVFDYFDLKLSPTVEKENSEGPRSAMVRAAAASCSVPISSMMMT